MPPLTVTAVALTPVALRRTRLHLPRRPQNIPLLSKLPLAVVMIGTVIVIVTAIEIATALRILTATTTATSREAGEARPSPRLTSCVTSASQVNANLVANMARGIIGDVAAALAHAGL